MDKFWTDYSEFYVNEPFYWWQPKGMAISPENLGLIKRKLRELRKFEGQQWRSVQRQYARDCWSEAFTSRRVPIANPGTFLPLLG